MSLLTRLAAFLVDAAIVWALAYQVYRLLPAVLPESPELSSFYFHVIRVTVSVAYHAVMLCWLSGTLGHATFRGMVVAPGGFRLGAGRCLTRAALGVLDVLVAPLLVNVVLVLVRRDRRHLYDFAAGTAVVRYRRLSR